MFPHEAQEVMAKILFLVFAAIILCFSRVNAAEQKPILSAAQNILIISQ